MTGESTPDQHNTKAVDESDQELETTQAKATPKIYLASLSDYNDGNLVGEWIDANQPPEDLYAAAEEMLKTSRMPGAEEFAIHDYEGFEAFRLHEYENLDTVSRIASGIVEHGRAFSHWLGFVGTSDLVALEAFEDHYRGQWPSMADYAENFTRDLGLDPERIGPSWIAPYVSIDFEGLGRDLSHDLEIAYDQGATYVFDPYQGD